MPYISHTADTSCISDYLQHPQACCAEGCAELFCQPSPAVSLQWTYRDGHLVNLPVILLVEGDIIALRPGAEAPTELRGIQVKVQPSLLWESVPWALYNMPLQEEIIHAGSPLIK